MRRWLKDLWRIRPWAQPKTVEQWADAFMDDTTTAVQIPRELRDPVQGEVLRRSLAEKRVEVVTRSIEEWVAAIERGDADRLDPPEDLIHIVWAELLRREAERKHINNKRRE